MLRLKSFSFGAMEGLKRILISLIVCLYSATSLSAIAPASIAKHTGVPMIKVKVGTKLNKIFISGTDLKRTIHIGNETKSYPGRKAIRFNCKNIVKEKGINKPIFLASISSGTGLVSLKDSKFRGKLHIITNTNNKSCDVVQETSVDDYISSLLSKEMNASWHLEALKAQAVAARTYALHKIKTQQVSLEEGHEAYYDIESSEKHQVGGSFFDATKRTVEASDNTAGYILLAKKGDLTPIFFHAKCGGRTLRPDQVWTNIVSGYTSVPCPYCDSHGKKSWNKSVRTSRFKKFLSWAKNNGHIKKGIKNLKKARLRLAPDKFFGNKLRVYLGDTILSIDKTLLRRFFGRFLVPSNNFKVTLKNGFLRIFGKGLGHGVGMCQLGALDLAKKGWGFKKILSHYFPGHELKKIY